MEAKRKQFFFEKRTKKLLLIDPARYGIRFTSKSFLVLFFKKELLPCLVSMTDWAETPVSEIGSSLASFCFRQRN
jgi:hypothetical protein